MLEQLGSAVRRNHGEPMYRYGFHRSRPTASGAAHAESWKKKRARVRRLGQQRGDALAKLHTFITTGTAHGKFRCDRMALHHPRPTVLTRAQKSTDEPTKPHVTSVSCDLHARQSRVDKSATRGLNREKL